MFASQDLSWMNTYFCRPIQQKSKALNSFLQVPTVKKFTNFQATMGCRGDYGISPDGRQVVFFDAEDSRPVLVSPAESDENRVFVRLHPDAEVEDASTSYVRWVPGGSKLLF